MADNETIWDADGPYLHSRDFSFANLEFHLRIAGDHMSYILLVTNPEGESETISNLQKEVIEWPAERVFNAYQTGELREE